jgi:hypothetical protein
VYKLPLPIPLREGAVIALVEDMRGGGFKPSDAEAMMRRMDVKVSFRPLECFLHLGSWRVGGKQPRFAFGVENNLENLLLCILNARVHHYTPKNESNFRRWVIASQLKIVNKFNATLNRHGE